VEWHRSKRTGVPWSLQLSVKPGHSGDHRIDPPLILSYLRAIKFELDSLFKTVEDRSKEYLGNHIYPMTDFIISRTDSIHAPTLFGRDRVK
jgi:hypothetical protein